MRPVQAVAQAVPPIHFREDGGPGPAQIAGVLLLTIVLLVAAFGAAVFAKRRGWLQRWIVEAATRNTGMRVLEVLRLSPRSRVYRISIDGKEYLVLESTATASMLHGNGVSHDARG